MLFNWNSVPADPEPQAGSPKGSFFDETLRDGIQAPTITAPSLEQKVQIVDHMMAAGIRSADLGFPSSGPVAARECLELARYVAARGHPMSVAYAGRTHPSDIRPICEIAQRAGISVDAYLVIAVSPIRQYVEDWDTDFIVRNIRVAAQECRLGGVEFVLVLEDATRCTPEVLASVYDEAIDVGVRRVALCDTVGVAVPSGTEAIIRWSARYFCERGYPVAFDWHGHNDRGLAVINSLTALASGCERVHGTVLGVGERAGNSSIDQLLVNSHLDGHGHHDLMALRRYCEYASAVLGFEIPRNYPAMGQDVFTTSAGIHAAAILKAHEKADALVKDSVYSSIPASNLGREQEVLIDSASGVSNVKYWLGVRGRQCDDESIEKVLRVAKANGRPLNDGEIERILATHG
jgi:2-isopropylmalate synthase